MKKGYVVPSLAKHRNQMVKRSGFGRVFFSVMHSERGMLFQPRDLLESGQIQCFRWGNFYVWHSVRGMFVFFHPNDFSERVIFKPGSILVEVNETRSLLPILDKHGVQRNHDMSARKPNEISW